MEQALNFTFRGASYNSNVFKLKVTNWWLGILPQAFLLDNWVNVFIFWWSNSDYHCTSTMFDWYNIQVFRPLLYVLVSNCFGFTALPWRPFLSSLLLNHNLWPCQRKARPAVVFLGSSKASLMNLNWKGFQENTLFVPTGS